MLINSTYCILKYITTLLPHSYHLNSINILFFSLPFLSFQYIRQFKSDNISNKLNISKKQKKRKKPHHMTKISSVFVLFYNIVYDTANYVLLLSELI